MENNHILITSQIYVAEIMIWKENVLFQILRECMELNIVREVYYE